MAGITHTLSEIAPRAVRSTPFVAVVVCFLLPFFSVSSCDDGTETDATGFQIVAGSQLIKEQANRGPIGPDPQAQTVAAAARPWAALALVVAAFGGCLVATRNRRWRGIRAIAAGLALSSWVGAAVAADDAAPKHSRAEYNLEWGFVLPLLILVVTCVWAVWAMARAHDERADGSASLGPPLPAGRDPT